MTELLVLPVSLRSLRLEVTRFLRAKSSCCNDEQRRGRGLVNLALVVQAERGFGVRAAQSLGAPWVLVFDVAAHRSRHAHMPSVVSKSMRLSVSTICSEVGSG